MALATASPRAISPRAIRLQAASFQRAAASVSQDLATLRGVTAPFHRFETGMDAGWSAQITSCTADPNEGGMGFHYD